MKVAVALLCLSLVGCGSNTTMTGPDQGGGGVGGNGGAGGNGGGGGVGGNGGTGGTGGTGGAGGGGGSGGAGGAQDMAGGGFSCGSQTCSGGTVCCITGGVPACANSCGADGGFVASCHGPSDCGGNPCCISVTGWHVDSVMCAASTSDCVPMIMIASGTGKNRACNVDSDCTVGAGAMPQLPDCCTNTMSKQKVCFNKAYTQYVQGFSCP